MAMPDLNKVRAVFHEKLQTLTGIPTEARIWKENKTFTPPVKGTLWLRERLIPTAEAKVATKTAHAIGIIQYDVVHGFDQGVDSAETLAKTIAEGFEHGTDINSQGITVHIDRAQRAFGRIPLGEEGHWWFIPVSIYWRTYATTAA